MNEWSGTVLAAVTNSLWPAMALVLGTWFLLRFARQCNAATRHLIWWGVLAAIVAMPAAPGLLRVEHPGTAASIAGARAPRTFTPAAAAPEERFSSNSNSATVPVR